MPAILIAICIASIEQPFKISESQDFVGLTCWVLQRSRARRSSPSGSSSQPRSSCSCPGSPPSRGEHWSRAARLKFEKNEIRIFFRFYFLCFSYLVRFVRLGGLWTGEAGWRWAWTGGRSCTRAHTTRGGPATTRWLGTCSANWNKKENNMLLQPWTFSFIALCNKIPSFLIHQWVIFYLRLLLFHENFFYTSFMIASQSF